VEQKLKCVFLPIEDVVPVVKAKTAPKLPVPSLPAADGKESDVVKRLTLACEGYKLEIDRLNGLRQRGGADVKVKTVVVGEKGVVKEGMSVQVAAIIAILAFIIGVVLF
jgi:hypothetical protein